MTEEFLHYIWKFQLFNTTQLKLSSGESLLIKNPGIQNLNSGPDFFNSQIRIGKILWAGNTEIHIKSSDWFSHKHQRDEAYSKIILHVVWENDKEVLDIYGNHIPTLELKGLIRKRILDKFKLLKMNTNWIPCATEFNSVDKPIQLLMLNRALVERLETKSNRINQLLHLNKNDWEATLYQYLAKYFGFKTNAVPFELLATSIPYNMLLKVRDNRFKLSALLFGQAGFLDEEFDEEYPNALRKEFSFLKAKFNLLPLSKSLWKFMRMRPYNFPTIRIAQLIALFYRHTNLFQKIIEAESIETLKKLFDVRAEQYWDNHFLFNKVSSKKVRKTLGDNSINILIINTIIPLLFNYGKKNDREDIKERAISFLEQLPQEKNSIIKKWSTFNLKINSAYDTQALLQLKTSYCDSKNCLNCTIGNTILKRQNHD